MVTADASLAKKVLTYQQSRREGIELLLDQTNPDGSVDPVG